MAGKTQHGLSYTPEYRAWQTMRLRCTVPTNKAYPSYGGRGITVCDRWMDSVENFMADMGKKPGLGYELDRIDNNGNYEPGNCRWATRSVNDRNRRSTTYVIFNGEEHCLIDLCDKYGIRADTVKCRIKNGWSVEEALTTPARAKAPNGTKAQVNATGVPYTTVKHRLKQGWTMQEATALPKRFKKEVSADHPGRRARRLAKAIDEMNKQVRA